MLANSDKGTQTYCF